MNGTLSPSIFPINHSLSAPCEPGPQHISITVLVCLLGLGGALLNSFSLWVFCFRMKTWSAGTILQFHLGLSDAMATPAIPLMATSFAMGSCWPFRQFVCQLKIALLGMHFYGSVVFLTLISVHRYVAVVRHKSNSAMKRVGFIHKVCGAVWLFLLVQGMSCFVFLGTSQVGNCTQCLNIHQGEYIDAYFAINFVLLFFAFLLPFSIAAVCYCRLASSVSRINANSAKGQAIKARSLKMVAVCLLIFAVCFAPLNVTRTVGVMIKKYYPEQCRLLLKVETTYYIAWILACANSCFDPLLYCFGSPDFNRAVRSSLKWLGHRFQEASSNNEQDSLELPTRTAHSITFLDKEAPSNTSK
ncbi:P2Y purinoceptor 2 [Conger conger]|uniref:P2Y purinoceptor 2 n=1 Tax=Conger conger TaxID=82655 RepID=UPI002A5ACDEC|nr:P2Y purinoceptor 2 [Conger conger]XP_061115539.1 P2Y purinoceptor 2 [Conger conger]